jgi:hypothetical protein
LGEPSMECSARIRWQILGGGSVIGHPRRSLKADERNRTTRRGAHIVR